jgi:serine/threonine protein kinase
MIEGQTLRHWLAERPRPWTEIVAAFQHAGKGLAAAHRVQLVHRDFKPENVLVGSDGRVCVTDFGLARSVAQTAMTERVGSAHSGPVPASLMFTRTGYQIGTPAYMAPEQFSGDPTDDRTDQFSFCVALYEALYGQRPFEGDSVETLSRKVLAGVPRTPPPTEVPQAIHAAVLRGLSVALDARSGRPRRRVALWATAASGCALVVMLAVWRMSSSDSVETTPSPPTTMPTTAVAADPAATSPAQPDPAGSASPLAAVAAAAPAPPKLTKPAPKASASHHRAVPARKSSHDSAAATTRALPSRTDLEAPSFAKAPPP